MTSNDLKRPQLTSKEVINENFESLKSKNENSLKGGSLHNHIETNAGYSDEILHKNNLQMDLAVQTISNDQTKRSDTIQDLRVFNSQYLETQAKKRRTISFNVACY